MKTVAQRMLDDIENELAQRAFDYRRGPTEISEINGSDARLVVRGRARYFLCTADGCRPTPGRSKKAILDSILRELRDQEYRTVVGRRK